MKTLPNYHPPADYRRPTKTQEKVYVPVNDYPEINFSTELTPLTPRFLSRPLPCLRLDEACSYPQFPASPPGSWRVCSIAMSLTRLLTHIAHPF